MNGWTQFTESFKDIIDSQIIGNCIQFHLKPAKGKYSNDPNSGVYITVGINMPDNYVTYRGITYRGTGLNRLHMLVQGKKLEKEIDSAL